MTKQVKITIGKCWDSEFAPIGWRFQRTNIADKDVFNSITRRYKSARDWKKRFHWNNEHKFWYTQDNGSYQEALKELEYRGYRQ